MKMSIRELYRFRRYLRERLSEVNDPVATDTLNELIKEVSGEIHKWSNPKSHEPDFVIEHRIVRQHNSDGNYIELYLLDPSMSNEQVRRFIDDQVWIEQRPSMYDCTGQRFSHWYSIFNTPRGWRIYHCVGIDW